MKEKKLKNIPETSDSKKSISARVDLDIYDMLDAMCKRDKRSQSFILSELIRSQAARLDLLPKKRKG